MIFENATLITVDAGRRIIRDGAIAVSGKRIVGVGKREEILRQFPDDHERVNLKGMAVIPGLINTHVHLAQCLLRGCADDMDLPSWLLERVWVLQGNYDHDDGRVSAELCILEMLKSGTTAFVESFLASRYGFDGIAQVVEYSGIRAALSKIVMDTPTYTKASQRMHPGMVEDREASMREAVTMHEKWDGAADGRIQVWFGPRPPGGSTADLYKEMMAVARERKMRVNMHLAEERSRVEYIRETYNMSPIEFVESVGMVGPDVLLIHCVNLDRNDIRRVAETGTHITHNPASNAKLGMGAAPLVDFLAAGVNVSLGTDGGPANNAYDMIRDFRWASYLHKAIERDPTVIPAETVLEMATINGAKAMGLENEIGSIEVGKKADFVAINMDQPHLVPAPDLVSTIVYCASGQDVDTVVIDGRIVVSGREVLTMDEDRILAEARQRTERLYQRAGVTLQSRWPVV